MPKSLEPNLVLCTRFVTTEPSLQLLHFYSEIGSHLIAWTVLNLVVLLPQTPR